MDGIIEVKVFGNHLSKDSKYAGVRGEGNTTSLRITLDESWDIYEKEAVFWNAHGQNAVKIVLTPLHEDEPKNGRVYLVAIPPEAMGVAGQLTFAIYGKQNGLIKISTEGKLEVKDSPDILESVPPTPNELQQMQIQVDKIRETIHDAVEAKEDILNMGVSAVELPEGAEAYVNKTEEDGVVHLNFGLPKGDKGDSGIHIGTEAPTDEKIKVWIDPDATGGEDYNITPEDKADIVRMVKEELAEIEKTATLTASGWVGTSAPYSQTITVEGITAETNGTVGIAESATDEQYTTASYASLRKVAQGTDSITIKAYGEKPAVDIPLTVRMGG